MESMYKQSIWERDLPLFLAKFYKNIGQRFPKNPEHGLIDLVEWLLRVPAKIKRNLYKSQELNDKILTPFELRGLKEIEKIITNGGDLKPYLGNISKTIRNRYSMKNDFFASDWGLLHFHLGADFENKGIKVSRTKRVLITRFEKTNSYLIDIVNHGKDYGDVWGEIKHLEILYRNWPYILGNGSLFEHDKKIPPISSHDYIRLRKSGITMPIVIDGKIFVAPGLGISTDGSQVQASRISLQIQRELDYLEKEFRKVEPDVDAKLAIRKDYSIGFLIPKRNEYYQGLELYKNTRVS